MDYGDYRRAEDDQAPRRRHLFPAFDKEIPDELPRQFRRPVEHYESEPSSPVPLPQSIKHKQQPRVPDRPKEPVPLALIPGLDLADDIRERRNDLMEYNTSWPPDDEKEYSIRTMTDWPDNLHEGTPGDDHLQVSIHCLQNADSPFYPEERGDQAGDLYTKRSILDRPQVNQRRIHPEMPRSGDSFDRHVMESPNRDILIKKPRSILKNSSTTGMRDYLLETPDETKQLESSLGKRSQTPPFMDRRMVDMDDDPHDPLSSHSATRQLRDRPPSPSYFALGSPGAYEKRRHDIQASQGDRAPMIADNYHHEYMLRSDRSDQYRSTLPERRRYADVDEKSKLKQSRDRSAETRLARSPPRQHDVERHENNYATARSEPQAHMTSKASHDAPRQARSKFTAMLESLRPLVGALKATTAADRTDQAAAEHEHNSSQQSAHKRYADPMEAMLPPTKTSRPSTDHMTSSRQSKSQHGPGYSDRQSTPEASDSPQLSIQSPSTPPSGPRHRSPLTVDTRFASAEQDRRLASQLEDDSPTQPKMSCPICKAACQVESELKSHVVKQHLPWYIFVSHGYYMGPQEQQRRTRLADKIYPLIITPLKQKRDPLECVQKLWGGLLLGFLEYVREVFGMRNTVELLTFIRANKLYGKPIVSSDLSLEEKSVLTAVAVFRKQPGVSSQDATISLFNWKTLANLISVMPDECRITALTVERCKFNMTVPVTQLATVRTSQGERCVVKVPPTDHITNQRQPFQNAIYAGAVETICKMAKDTANIVYIQIRHVNGGGPVAYALSVNKETSAAVLMINGASVDQQDIYGMTALHRAVKAGSVAHVKFLLQWSPKLHLKNRSGSTVMDLAQETRDTVILRELNKALQTNLPAEPNPGRVPREVKDSFVFAGSCSPTRLLLVTRVTDQTPKTGVHNSTAQVSLTTATTSTDSPSTTASPPYTGLEQALGVSPQAESEAAYKPQPQNPAGYPPQRGPLLRPRPPLFARPPFPPPHPMGSPMMPMGRPRIPMGRPRMPMGGPRMPMGSPSLPICGLRMPMGGPRMPIGGPRMRFGEPRVPLGSIRMAQTTKPENYALNRSTWSPIITSGAITEGHTRTQVVKPQPVPKTNTGEQNKTKENTVTPQSMDSLKLASVCPICNVFDYPLKTHVVTKHLPWYVYAGKDYYDPGMHPQRKTSLAEKLQEAVFVPVSKNEMPLSRFTMLWGELLHGLLIFLKDNLDLFQLKDLLSDVKSGSMYPSDERMNTLSAEEEFMFTAHQMFNSTEKKKVIVSPPDQITSLLHWKTLANVIACLPKAVQKEVRTLENYTKYMITSKCIVKCDNSGEKAKISMAMPGTASIPKEACEKFKKLLLSSHIPLLCNLLSANPLLVYTSDDVCTSPVIPGASPVMYALSINRIDAAKILMTYGASPDQLDKAGWTPLHRSALAGKMSHVRVLLQWGANPMLKNPSGETAAEIAKSKKYDFLALTIQNAVDECKTQSQKSNKEDNNDDKDKTRANSGSVAKSTPQSNDDKKLVDNDDCCRLCPSISAADIRDHVLKSHLPWYVGPEAAYYAGLSKEMKKTPMSVAVLPKIIEFIGVGKPLNPKLANVWGSLLHGLLDFIAVNLDLKNYKELHAYAVENKIGTRYNEKEGSPYCTNKVDMKLIRLHASYTNTSCDSMVVFPPSCLSALLHWPNLMELVNQVPETFRKIIQSLELRVDPNGKPIVEPLVNL